MLKQNESSLFQSKLSINIQGFLMDFSTARIMGIVNLTPDSFYDGAKIFDDKSLLKQVEIMLGEGADILDLGAFSSRPGAELITAEEEIKRLIPALKTVRKEFPEAVISIDTYRSSVAEAAIREGAQIINDISGAKIDPKLIDLVAQQNLPYILMHMQGLPADMQQNPQYQNVVTEVYGFLHEKIKLLRERGCSNLIIDPGFGFGKKLEHNYQLLKNLNYFKNLDCPILVGISRKKMIQKLVEQEVDMALNGSTVAHTIALLNGANILRVHDVKEAKEAAAIVAYMQKQ